MTSIIDRYISATQDGIPGNDRADIEREVRAALNDMIESRIAQGLSEEQAEREAIEELGDPKAFAAQFHKQERYLIGPRLFGSWWLITQTILLIITPIVMGATLFGVLAGTDSSYGQAFGEAIGAGFSVAIQVLFWVTLIYAIIERIGVTPEMEGSLVSKSDWTIDDLPEIETGRQIGKFEIVLQVVPVSLLAWFVSRLAIDGLSAMGLHRWLDVPRDLPAFNPELSALWFWGLIGLVVMNVLVAVWSFMVGYWTRIVTTVNVMLAVVWIAFIMAVASAGDIMNPEIRAIHPDLGEWSLVGENSSRIIVGIFILVSAWDVWESVRGHLAYRRQVSQGSAPNPNQR